MTALTVEVLRERLHYDPETGVFRWRVKPRQQTPAGAVAGCLRPDGYREITVKGRTYLAHRLAWFFVTGEWPVDHVDHRNLMRDDNRWGNLREASHLQNMRNRTRQRNNSSGVKGVCFDAACGKWRAQIEVCGKNIYLGVFVEIDAAAAAYAKAASQYHRDFARAE